MSTIAPPAGRRRVAAAHLTDRQKRFIKHVLTRLGTADGLAEDDPPVPYSDRAERLALTELAARAARITVTDGCEIAQCYDCADIVDGALTTEDAGIVRCDDCHIENRANDPDPYDLWADFYRH